MNIEEIQIGKAWFEEGMAYFKLNSSQDFLTKKQFKDFTTTQMSHHPRSDRRCLASR